MSGTIGDPFWPLLTQRNHTKLGGVKKLTGRIYLGFGRFLLIIRARVCAPICRAESDFQGKFRCRECRRSRHTRCPPSARKYRRQGNHSAILGSGAVRAKLAACHIASWHRATAPLHWRDAAAPLWPV